MSNTYTPPKITDKDMALLRAVDAGQDVHGVIKCLAEGANADVLDGTAVILACLQNNWKTLQVLLGAGANARASNSLALTLAAESGYDRHVQILLAHGARVDDIGGQVYIDHLSKRANPPAAIVIQRLKEALTAEESEKKTRLKQDFSIAIKTAAAQSEAADDVAETLEKSGHKPPNYGMPAGKKPEPVPGA